MPHRSVGIHKYRINDLSFVLDFPVESFIDVCFYRHLIGSSPTGRIKVV